MHVSAPPRRLTFDSRFAKEPAWTPDSQRIVFASQRQGDGTLWSLEPFSSRPKPVLIGGENAYAPSVDTSGRKVAYTRNTLIDSLRVSPLTSLHNAGAPLRRLDYPPRLARHPAYSPDGRWVAFESPRSGCVEIWISASDGSQARQLTKLRNSVTGSPRWSPDAKWIVFDSRVGNKGKIFVISSAGGTARRLSTSDSEDVVPDWSHDGRWIYFSSQRSGNYQVWKMPAEGGTAIQITRQGGFHAQESPGRPVSVLRQIHRSHRHLARKFSGRLGDTDNQILI